MFYVLHNYVRKLNISAIKYLFVKLKYYMLFLSAMYMFKHADQWD